MDPPLSKKPAPEAQDAEQATASPLPPKPSCAAHRRGAKAHSDSKQNFADVPPSFRPWRSGTSSRNFNQYDRDVPKPSRAREAAPALFVQKGTKGVSKGASWSVWQPGKGKSKSGQTILETVGKGAKGNAKGHAKGYAKGYAKSQAAANFTGYAKGGKSGCVDASMANASKGHRHAHSQLIPPWSRRRSRSPRTSMRTRF